MLSDVKSTFFNGQPDNFREQLKEFVSHFGMNFEDVKDMSVAALIGKMLLQAGDDESRSSLQHLMKLIRGAGLAEKRVASLGVTAGTAAD